MHSRFALLCIELLVGILWLPGGAIPVHAARARTQSPPDAQLAAPGHLPSAETPSPAQHETQTTVEPKLEISDDDRINSSCHLGATQKSLKAESNSERRLALIQKFNACVRKNEQLKLHSQKLNIAPLSTASSAAPNQEPAPEGTTQQQYTQGEQVTQSAWTTPDACGIGTAGAMAAKGILYVHRALVWPKQASDDFGYRLGKRFVVYQVSVTNASKDFQYEVSDIVVDLGPIFTQLPVPKISTSGGQRNPNATFEASSQDLSMLRGVPEKGMDYDPRNMTLHILQGVGAVGAGISGLTPFSDVMGSAMANFNGAFIQAITGIAPDHTSTQLNRLSDMAFTSNTLIGKLQTKKFAVFIPEDFVIPRNLQKAYWKDPRQLLNTLPFDQLNVCVDGILLVQAAATPDPAFSTAESNVLPNSTISLTDSATAATIYYTANGDTPTTNSTKYSVPIPIGALGSGSVTIKAFAMAADQAPSNTIVGTFTPALAAQKPVITCGSDKKSATIAPTTANDTVYYTVDGTPPNRQSTSITASTTVTFSGVSETIQAVEVGNSTSLSPVVSQSCPAS